MISWDTGRLVIFGLPGFLTEIQVGNELLAGGLKSNGQLEKSPLSQELTSSCHSNIWASLFYSPVRTS